MGTNLMKAHHEWATRPADERFASVADLLAFTRQSALTSKAANVKVDTLRFLEGDEGQLLLEGSGGQPYPLTNWSFTQASGLAGAPAGYLSQLPARLAAACLNDGLARHGRDDYGQPAVVQLYATLPAAPQRRIRALTSPSYSRIQDYALAEMASELTQRGWSVPASRGQPGGLYASDRDCFIFLESKPVAGVEGSPELTRFLMLWNSEVGRTSLGILAGYCDMICGNHIVWGAKNYREIRFRHVGRIYEKAEQVYEVAHAMSGDRDAVAADVDRFNAARTQRIAATEAEVIAAVRKMLGLPERTVSAAWRVAETTPRYGDPRSPWAMLGGLTEVAQKADFAANVENRRDIEVAAAKLLDARWN